jgi:hypothetical protein
MKQTAVEWLQKKYWKKLSTTEDLIIFQQAKEMEKKQRESFAVEFYKWLISQDGKDTIHDTIMFGEISKNPTPKELFQLFKNK